MKYFVLSVLGHFRLYDHQFTRLYGNQESHRQFGAVGKSPRTHGTSPDHDFIEHCGNQSAMHDLLESDVLGSHRETRLHEAAIGFKPQAQAGSVRFATDETGMGVW